MANPSVYIETSIVSYLTARVSRDLVIAAHCQITQEWWERRRAAFILYTAQPVIKEASAGDAEMVTKRLAALDGIPLLTVNQAANDLAKALIIRGPIPPKAAIDALHIATAAVHRMDYLLTWNCKHIANAEMQRTIATRCLAAGCKSPVLCTPEELLGS